MNIQPEIIELPKIIDARGNLSVIEESMQIPFEIKRTYWIYDVPGGEIRGSHAYHTLSEFIVALSGSFDIVLHDGEKEFRFHLNRSYQGVLIPKLYWRKLENFSTNSVALILADQEYDEKEYIRDFETFKQIRNNEK